MKTEPRWIKPPEGHVWEVGQRIKLAGAKGEIMEIHGTFTTKYFYTRWDSSSNVDALDLSLFPDILVEEVRPRMRTINVRCSFVIPVEVPDTPDYNVEFDIEENHCPGTGLVGSALDAHIEKHEKIRSCWACALGGTNEILDEITE